jgi:hypothetical protein
MNREGVGIAGIAVIARNRKSKGVTTKDTRSTPLSQAQGRSGQATKHKEESLSSTPISAHPRENRARTGPGGMTWDDLG